MNNNNCSDPKRAGLIKKIRRSANVGLYGSLIVIIAVVIFHFCPYTFAQQTEEVQRMMLIVGMVVAVLAVVLALLAIRKSTPRIRLMDDVDKKIEAYASYISTLYGCTFVVAIIECAIILLMSDTSLLMVTMLLVLLLFLSYPNMYKMKHDLALTDETMKELFGDAYIADPEPAEVGPDFDLADAKLAQEAEVFEDAEVLDEDHQTFDSEAEKQIDESCDSKENDGSQN